MSSPAQIAANRRNTQKSTGPRTAPGKARSSMNALQSGIYALNHCLPGEDVREFAHLVFQYHAEFRPFTVRQRDLVDTLAQNQWKIQRLRLVETAMWNGLLSADHINAEMAPKAPWFVMDPANIVNPVYLKIDARIEALQRRIHAYERSSQRALRELRELQVSEAGLGQSDPALPELVDATAPSGPFGFVPSKFETEPPAPAPPPPDPQSPTPDPPPPPPPVGNANNSRHAIL